MGFSLLRSWKAQTRIIKQTKDCLSQCIQIKVRRIFIYEWVYLLGNCEYNILQRLNKPESLQAWSNQGLNNLSQYMVCQLSTNPQIVWFNMLIHSANTNTNTIVWILSDPTRLNSVFSNIIFIFFLNVMEIHTTQSSFIHSVAELLRVMIM